MRPTVTAGASGEKNKNKRQLQAEQTRLLIFNAAMRLLRQMDFEEITVRDIVREANVSIGSFYNYFKTKLDVFYETYQIADVYFETKVRPKLTQRSAKKRILYFFHEYAHYSADISGLSLTRVLYNSDNTFFHRETGTGMLPILTDLIRHGQESGELTTGKSAAKTASFLMTCVRGIVYDWCISGGAYDLDKRVTEYLPMLLRPFESDTE